MKDPFSTDPQPAEVKVGDIVCPMPFCYIEWHIKPACPTCKLKVTTVSSLFAACKCVNCGGMCIIRREHLRLVRNKDPFMTSDA